MKNLLTLTDLTRNELQQILETATQMRRIALADCKRGPQLIGRLVAGCWKKPCLCSSAFQMATAYLSGECVTAFDCDDELEQCLGFDAMGANTVVVSCNSDNLLHTLSLRCRAHLINGGSRQSDPIGVLADLMTLYTKLDTLSNLNVLAVGNRDVNKINELTHCLQLYGSNLVWYLPTDDVVTTRRGIVLDKPKAAFAGVDAVTDLGLAAFSEPEKYYGSSGGITRELMDLASVNCPLLGARNIVDVNIVKEYEYNAVSARQSCYVSVAMAVLYLMQRV